MRPAVGRYGRLYEVRQKGGRPYLCGESHLNRNGWDMFVEVHPLFVDDAYRGESPAYWMAGTCIYPGDCSREYVQRQTGEVVHPLRFQGRVQQTSMEQYAPA